MILTSMAIFTSANKINIGINNLNNPPNPPEIEGPTNGKIRENYIYFITVTDPDEDDKLLKLEVDFGDGIISEDCGCDVAWDNGEVIEMGHVWKKQGFFQVSARVTDIHNIWSEWSEPISVTMPKNKFVNINCPPFLYKILTLFQIFY